MSKNHPQRGSHIVDNVHCSALVHFQTIQSINQSINLSGFVFDIICTILIDAHFDLKAQPDAYEFSIFKFYSFHLFCFLYFIFFFFLTKSGCNVINSHLKGGLALYNVMKIFFPRSPPANNNMSIVKLFCTTYNITIK